MTTHAIDDFVKSFGFPIPDIYFENIRLFDKFILLNSDHIMNLVDFHPPFLKTDKIAIFGDKIEGSVSIGTGLIYLDDVKGHYNNTVYLALAGRLMPSTATIHLTHFFPNTSPQAVEGKSIRMDKNPFNNGLIQPALKGSRFFVETRVTKKKLNLVLVQTKIYFGLANFGLIEDLKFILADKDSIYKAVVVPEIN